MAFADDDFGSDDKFSEFTFDSPHIDKNEEDSLASHELDSAMPAPQVQAHAKPDPHTFENYQPYMAPTATEPDSQPTNLSKLSRAELLKKTQQKIAEKERTKMLWRKTHPQVTAKKPKLIAKRKSNKSLLATHKPNRHRSYDPSYFAAHRSLHARKTTIAKHRAKANRSVASTPQ